MDSDSKVKDNYSTPNKINSSSLHNLLQNKSVPSINIDFSMFSNTGNFKSLIEKAKKYRETTLLSMNKDSCKTKTISKAPKALETSIKSPLLLPHPNLTTESRVSSRVFIPKNLTLLQKLSRKITKKLDFGENDLVNQGDLNDFEAGKKMGSEENNKGNFVGYNTEIGEKKKNVGEDGMYVDKDKDDRGGEELENCRVKKVRFSKDVFMKKRWRNLKMGKSEGYGYNTVLNKSDVSFNSKNQTFSAISGISPKGKYSEKTESEGKSINVDLDETKTSAMTLVSQNTTNNNILATETNYNFANKHSNEYETVKDTYSIKNCSAVLEYSFREDQNVDTEPTMEDKSKSIENFNSDKTQMLFEIFDGHGGDEVSSYLQQNFSAIYKGNLEKYFKGEEELRKEEIHECLEKSFKEADSDLRSLSLDAMGSTGTIIHLLLLSPSQLECHCANVGDTKAVLFSPQKTLVLSVDHRLDNEEEKKRIEQSQWEIVGNRILNKEENRGVMCTRAFGDFDFKEEEEVNPTKSIKFSYLTQNTKHREGIICIPSISSTAIDLKIKDQYIVLASDGIWDVLEEKEIQQIIYKNGNKDTELMCSLIIKNAIRKEAWDNLSVFVIKIS